MFLWPILCKESSTLINENLATFPKLEEVVFIYLRYKKARFEKVPDDIYFLIFSGGAENLSFVPGYRKSRVEMIAQGMIRANKSSSENGRTRIANILVSVAQNWE